MEVKIAMRPKTVWVPQGVVGRLARAYGCTRQSVSLAVNGKSDTPLSQKIRWYAIKELGGVAVKYYTDEEVASAPKCETTFDATRKTMTQNFGEGVVLTVSYAISRVSVVVDGRLVVTSDNATDHEFELLQKQAQEVARERSDKL